MYVLKIVKKISFILRLWTTWICVSRIQYNQHRFIKSHMKVQKVLLAIWEFLLHNMAYQKEPWETKKSLREVCFCFFDQLQFDNLGRGVLQKNEIYERTWLEHDFIHSHCLVPHCKFWWSFVQFYCEFPCKKTLWNSSSKVDLCNMH